MRDYELVLVVSPDGGEENFPNTVERVHTFIKDRGGEIKNVDQWGRRRLAYPVQRFTEGYYNITHFAFDPQQVRALEGSLDLAEDVLRHLVVRIDESKMPAVPTRGMPPVSDEIGEPDADQIKEPVLDEVEETVPDAVEEPVLDEIEEPAPEQV
ncbi:MAG: 30S ribosomal protein S6 [Dehalococcoidia bacterium]